MTVTQYTDTDRLPVSQEAHDIFKWSQELAKCKFYQKLGSGGIIAILLTARELRLPPMACLNGGLYHIDGKVSISAQMMNTLLLKAGHQADIKTLNEKKCVLHFKRADRTEKIEYSYTIEDAQKAGYLKKDNWKYHLKDMLFCRCLSGGARKICPDAIGNCYIHGELRQDTNQFQASNVQQVETETEQEEVKQISFEKAEGFDDFVKRYGLDKEDSERIEYVKQVAETSKKSENEVINFAVTNEAGFNKAFKSWKEQGTKKSKKVKDNNSKVAQENLGSSQDVDQEKLQ